MSASSRRSRRCCRSARPRAPRHGVAPHARPGGSARSDVYPARAPCAEVPRPSQRWWRRRPSARRTGAQSRPTASSSGNRSACPSRARRCGRSSRTSTRSRAACPGARLTKPPAGGRAEGEVNVKLGPIVSAFAGIVEVERDAANFRGVVRGAGRDAKSGSSARAIISYHVQAPDEASSQVDVSVKFLLTGALAQFRRSGLVRDVADHLTQVFARTSRPALRGRPPRPPRPPCWMPGRLRGRRSWRASARSFTSCLRARHAWRIDRPCGRTVVASSLGPTVLYPAAICVI